VSVKGNHTIYSVCSHDNQHVCFYPTYSPWEQWLEVQRFDSAIWAGGGGIRDLISTQVFNPNKPVSGFFDVCAAIDQDSGGQRGLAWERAYMLNGKYMYPDPCSRLCGGTSWHYCAYWSYVSWATWQTVGHLALLHKRTPILDCTLAIVIL
jgi:hypothetical protein